MTENIITHVKSDQNKMALRKKLYFKTHRVFRHKTLSIQLTYLLYVEC